MDGRPLITALAGSADIAALFTDAAELAALLEVEAALAAAEASAGVIAGAAAARIAAACRQFVPDWADLAEGMARDGIVVPALVRQLRAAVGDRHAAALHRGATSQDIVDSGLMLRLKRAAGIYALRLAALDAALERIAARDGALTLMAHTRMQEALPIGVADKVAAWRRPLARQAGRLAGLAPETFVVQLGGPVGTRAELGAAGDAVADTMAAILGLGVAPCWHTERDRIADLAGWLAATSGVLGKIGQDIALMAQNEVGAVRIAGAGGSSAMPHKSNPVGAEVLVALARLNAGLLGTLHQALVHEYERSGAALTLEWLVLPQMAVATGAALERAETLLAGLRFAAADGR